MYEVVVRIAGVETVVEVVDTIVTASNITSFHRQNGLHAFYRPVLKRVA